jgi:hypothetical protein
MSPVALLQLLFNPILNTPQDTCHVMFHISVMKLQDLQAEIL